MFSMLAIFAMLGGFVTTASASAWVEPAPADRTDPVGTSSSETSASTSDTPDVLQPLVVPPPVMSWSFGAFADLAYVITNNFPHNHVNRGMYTVPRSSEFTANLVVAYARHDPTPRSPWWVELAFQVGSAADALVLAEPRPGGTTSQLAGAEVWKHIGRANAGVVIPSLNTEIGAGLFGTPIGIWSFWAKDNWAYSTPWHLNGVPYVLMGAKIVQPLGHKVKLHGWIVNGWQTYTDINRVPSYMFGVFYTPVPSLTLGELVYFGPEEIDQHVAAWRWFSDAQLVYNKERVGIAALWDVGRERMTWLPGSPLALWHAGALSLRWRVIGPPTWRRNTWDMHARGEIYWDREGHIYGVPRNTFYSGVYTNDFRLFDHVLLRLEYRYDHASAASGYFYSANANTDDAGGLARHQHAMYLGLIGYFEWKLHERSAVGDRRAAYTAPI